MIGDNSGQMYNLSVWDPDTGTLLSSYKGGSSASHTVTMIGSDYIISAPPDKPLLNVWQNNRNEQLSIRMFTPGKVSAMTCSPKGHYLLVAVQEQISIYQISNGRLWCVLSSHYQSVTTMKFTTDGSHFVSAGADGQVLCWSLATVLSRRALPGLPSGQVGKPEAKWCWREHALPVTDLVISAGGLQGKVFSVSQDQTCKIYSIVSGQLLLSVAFDTPLSAIAISIDCDRVCVGGENGDISIFSLRNPPRTVSVTSETLDSLSVLKNSHKGCVTTLSLSLDGCQLASGGSDNTVKLWHIKSGLCVRSLQQKGKITSLQYMLPPPGMLQNSTWKPARKLVPLLKGCDPNQPFKVNLLCKEDKQMERLDDRIDIVDEGIEDSGASYEHEGKMKELVDINHQLYTFALKNILQTN